MKFFARVSSALIVAASVCMFAAGHDARADSNDRLRGIIEPITAKKPFRVGVTLVHFIDDYWKGQAFGILDEAKRSNVQIVRLLSADGYGKISEQIANSNSSN